MIGDKIRYFREKEGFTQQELADKLFLSDRAIGHYETGKRTPSIDTLIEIAKLLKVELDEFFKDETKRLMQMQYTYRQFKAMLFDFADQQVYDNLETKHFVIFMESDRYFVQLNREYMGSPMTYLIWLLDGFYLIPLKTEWWDGANETFLDIKEMKKVSKSDVDYIQKACGRSYIKSQNERSFAESIYKSLFESMDFTIHDTMFDDELYGFAYYETEGLYAFDYEKECFYAKNKQGTFKINFFDGEYDDNDFLVIEHLRLEDRTYLTEQDIGKLHAYVSLKDKEAKLLLNEFENTETLDARKEVGEKYRKLVAFVDKMKRILEVTEETNFFFLPTDEEVAEERHIEEQERKISRNKIHPTGIDSSKQNKVLFLYTGGLFFNAIYTQVIRETGYQLIKTIDDRELFVTGLKELVGTKFEPDILLINVSSNEDIVDYIKELRELTKSKILLLGSFHAKELVVRYLETGVNHFISTPTDKEQMKEKFDKVLGITETKN